MKIEITPELMQDYATAAGHAFVATLDSKYIAQQAYWLNQLTLSKFHKEPPELKLLVVVKGGNIQDIVTTDEKINVTVIDFDNLDAGDRGIEENSYPLTQVEPGYIEERIKEVNDEYELVDQKYGHGKTM